jgi:hypothetical protein
LPAALDIQPAALTTASRDTIRSYKITDTRTEGRALSRTYCVLLEALNHHRGKGQQKVVVEHVRTLSLVWSNPQGRGSGKSKERPMDRRYLAMPESPRCGAYSRRTGQPCRNAAMANGRCRMPGGGMPKGNRNALKHGRYSAEAIANRRALAVLVREMRSLSKKVD